jgi:putative nucleotidyltransferase with HDIG domain
MRRTAIRYGAVGVQGAGANGDREPLPTATLNFSLADETETLRWIQQEVETDRGVPLAEAEAVVRSLAVAMHGEGQIVLPLLQLKEFDQYTTTHSLNVSVLSMALAEYQGMSPRFVRQVGVAGLLHDLGKIRIPLEVLTKPGVLTPEERELMKRHPADGARMLMETGQRLELAAVVAYEHHIMLNGHGYPPLRFRRECHEASRIVHVCDIYDALRTNRPYRDAWSTEATLEYLEERAGIELDPELARAFVAMMQRRETRVARVHDDRAQVA